MVEAPPVPALPPLPPRRERRAAFSLLELLVVIGLIAVLLALVLPVISKARAASRSVSCLSNLRQLSTAFHLFAERHDHRFPDPSVTQVSWESSLTPFVSGRVFACPAD